MAQNTRENQQIQNESVDYPKWWIETMVYIRKKPGKIYKSELLDFIDKWIEDNFKQEFTINNIVDKLNEYSVDASHLCIIEDEVTGEIYTELSIRKELDLCLSRLLEKRYNYNKFLYYNNFKCYGSLKIINCKKHFNFLKKYITVNCNSICIDISVDKSHPYSFMLGKFNLFDLIEKSFSENFPEIIYVEKLNLNGRIFMGDINISLDTNLNHRIIFTNGIQMEQVAVKGNLLLQDIILSYDSDKGDDVSGVSFRNSCFFGRVDIRGVTCTNTNLGNKISFEDAKLHQGISIVNSFFGHVALCFFQTILPRNSYCSSITVANVFFEDDSLIDFSELYMESGKVNIENIPHLPKAYFNFSPSIHGNKKICPDIVLSIKNCGIYNTIYISNVSELTFQNTQNYSHIIPNKNWADIDYNFWNECHSGIQYMRYSGITNKMLLAVYNFNQNENIENSSISKGQECVMLKENFASLGMYDDEDEAYILYMEYKPILDNIGRKKKAKLIKPRLSSKILYKCLYIIGKYGISPLRVACSLVVNIVIFAVLYFIMYLWMFENSEIQLFILGNVNFEMNSIQSILFGALLYSIANIVPFVCQFEPGGLLICVFSIVENLLGCFLVGYFSVALIRRTLR